MSVSSSFAADAIAIWRAGVAAVDSQRLVESSLQRDGDRLTIGGEALDLQSLRRILVIGGGKAGAGMAAGVEAALGPEIVAAKVDGWVNVPADCVRTLQRITLHAARPAGVNEPTSDGVFGVEQILHRAGTLQPVDLCLVLLSGGGSALMPAPIPGITLDDKLAVTRKLSQGGATIAELNAVRSRLSRFKGGGLLRAIPAGKVFVLIISDVIGDPLDVIASGPTVPISGERNPLEILQKFCPQRDDLPDAVWQALESPSQPPGSTADGIFSPLSPGGRGAGGEGDVTVIERAMSKQNPVSSPSSGLRPPSPSRGEGNSKNDGVTARHLVIGNNRTALDAAAAQARQLGYQVRDLGSDQAGVAREVGVEFAETCLQEVRDASQRVCVLSGGEPVVRLAATNQPRRGGRNQELVLAAAVRLWNEDLSRLAILSGGTDGEDGPTNAAGAWFDASVRQQAEELGLDPQAFLAINNAYPFFAQTGGLLITGPTHTNVMDLRVGIVGARPQHQFRKTMTCHGPELIRA